ncbi:hypothetical protein ACJQWK_06164 [Exserohilum turcicum]
METSSIGNQGNVFLEDDQEISADTELLPFRQRPGKFWTTNECRDTAVLGYAYPETQRWKFGSDAAYQSSVGSVIAKLYSGRLRSQVAAAQVSAFGHSLSDNSNVFTEWTVETRAATCKLPSTFRVDFSLMGMFQSDDIVDAGSWMVLAPEHAGTRHGTNATCGLEKVVHGTTSITSHLIDRINKGRLASLKAEDVAPYLQDALTWNVFDVSWQPMPYSSSFGTNGMDRAMAIVSRRLVAMHSQSRSSARKHVCQRMQMRRLSSVPRPRRILRLQ